MKYIKNHIVTLLVILNFAILPKSFSQNVSINSTGNLPDSSAMLDVSSTTKGFLMPRMTTAQRDAIILPATGLALFNTTLVAYQVNTGTPTSPVWSTLNSGSASVSSVSVTTANGVSGTVANATTTPAITLTLGAITPTSVAATGTVTGSNLSGTNTGNVTIGTANGLSLEGQSLSLGTASAATTGALTNTDWNTFNNKQPQLNGTGFLKASGTTISYDNSTYLTGNQAITFAPTGDVTGSASGSTTIAPALIIGTNKVLNTMLAQMPTLTIKGNNTGSTGNAADLTGAQVNTILPVFTSTLNGLVPFGGGSAGKVLHADGTWKDTAAATNQWSITGNNGTSYLTNFIGTTDNNSLRFRTNNQQRMKIDSSAGNVAIGQDTFDLVNPEKLVINAGVTNSVNAFFAKGSINSYVQMNIKNLSAGSNATTDIVATADNGTEFSNYVDLGINGSGYTGSAIQTGVANDGYLISSGNDFYMVNNNANKSMLFLTGGPGVANERMRILANGRVGIGVPDPTAPFVVKDTMEIRRVGSLSQLLFTNTAGSGDFRIGGDGGDLFWQGGGGRNLQMGSFWTTILTGDRQTSVYPSFISAVGGTGVLVLGQRDASVPLAIQSNSGTQSANLTEWRNSAGTAIGAVSKDGYLGLGSAAPTSPLFVSGTNPVTLLGVQLGSGTDSLLTISGGIVKKLPSSSFATGTNSWGATGNTGTTSVTNFIGTTDNKSFKIKTNNTQAVLVDSLGNVAIGTTPSPDVTNPEKFVVNAGTTSSVNAIVGKGNINNYLQLNIQNQSAGTAASSDVVATANNGNETMNYIDMGINGGSNTSGVMGVMNDGYLYNVGQNLFVGTATVAKSLIFVTGGTDSAANERMRIDGSGNIGIGVANPSAKLDVNGTGRFTATNPLTLLGVQAGAVTDSILTITSGTVKKLPFASVSSGASWSLTGNSGISPLTNFVGTTDNKSLRFRTNNVERVIVDSLGDVGIGGSSTPTEKLTVASAANGINSTNTSASSSNYAISATATAGIGVTASSSTGNALNATSWSGNGVTASSTSGFAVYGNSGSYTGIYGTTAGANQTAVIGTTSATGATGVAGTSTSGVGVYGSSASGSALYGIATTSSANPLLLSGLQAGALTDSFLTITSSVVKKLPLTALSAFGISGSGTNNYITKYTGASTAGNSNIFDNGTSVGIGSTTFDGTNPEELLVNAGTTTSVNAIVGKGSINNYLQLNIQNQSSGTAASSDVVATANNGNETTNYIDMGINSSGNSSGAWGGVDDAYLYNNGQNLLIGTATAAKSLIFMTGGTAQGTNERMRIDGSGSVGIGVSAPLSKLDNNGSVGNAITTTSGNLTLDATHHTVIITSGSPTLTLPAANTCARREYVIVNETAFARTVGSYINFSAATVTTMAANSSITIQSNGTSWYRIQ